MIRGAPVPTWSDAEGRWNCDCGPEPARCCAFAQCEEIEQSQRTEWHRAEAFPGPPLEPNTIQQRARMNQILGIAQAYFRGCISGGGSINYYRAFAPKVGVPVDEAAVQLAVPRARVIVGELERLFTGPFFTGPLSLADLMVAPVVFVFRATDEGRSILADAPKVSAWLERIEARPSASVLALP